MGWAPVLDLPTRQERPGLKTEFSYDSAGLLQSRTDTDTTTQSAPYSTGGQTRTWTYTWNGNGRLSSINGPKGVDAGGFDDIDSFTYDTSGNLLTSKNALGHVTTFSNYDANGRPGQMKDPAGVYYTYTYDGLGRVQTVTIKDPVSSAKDAVTTLEYDAEGRVNGVTAPATEKIFIDYDLAGRMTAVRAANGEKQTYTYDAMGDVTAESVKRIDSTAARTITRTFDELGRVLAETLGGSRTKSWSYDAQGNVLTATGARSNATTSAFDPLDRLVSSVAPDTGATSQAYDNRDNMTSFTDAKTLTTTLVRNGFGDVISEASPDRGTSTYYYDAAGDRIAEVDGRGQRIDYVRDALGRITKKTPMGKPASEIITYTYDTAGITGSYGKGRLASVTDASGTTFFKYDHRGNLLTKQQTIGTTTAATLQYGYDLADRVTSITYPSGRVVSYARDTKGRVVTIRTRSTATGTDTTLASGITYEPFGSLLKAVLGNTLTMAQSWGNDARLASRRLYRTSGGTNLSSLTYGYDDDDDITAITDNVDATKSVTYAYDPVSRLTRSVASAGTVRRLDTVYDLNGNRVRVESRTNAGDTNPVATDTYALTAGTNRLASIAGPSGARSIGYDARGNTLSETRPGAITVSAGYDGYARLISYQNSASATLANVYNGLDDRVQVTSSTDVRRYVYDAGGRMLGEYGTSASDVKAETVWLTPDIDTPNQPFGGDDGAGGYAPLAIVTGGAITWAYGNHLGVPIVLTDASGNAAAPTGYTRVGFPGQTQTLADLYYNRYRDYDPTSGRYIQADPIGLAGGGNPYAYAANNPINRIDSLGLQSETSVARACVAAPEVCVLSGLVLVDLTAVLVEPALINRRDLDHHVPMLGSLAPPTCPDAAHPSKCKPFYDAIDGTVGWIQRKEMQQANGQADQVPGHHKAIIGYATNLLRQVNVAKGRGCFNFNPDARRIIFQYLGQTV